MKTEAVIFNWVGTTIDDGSLAPLMAFQRTFARFGVTLAEHFIRRGMGLDDLAHLRQLLQDEVIRTAAAAYFAQPSTAPLTAQVQELYQRELVALLPTRAQLKPGVSELIAYLDANRIPYGTTSNYDSATIAALLSLVKAQGFQPRVSLTREDADSGLPDPAMDRLAMAQLGVQHPARAMIVGDTFDAIRAAQAAGANAVGVIEGGAALPLGKNEWAALNASERQAVRQQVRRAFASAGADMIVNNAWDLRRLLQSEATVTV